METAIYWFHSSLSHISLLKNEGFNYSCPLAALVFPSSKHPKCIAFLLLHRSCKAVVILVQKHTSLKLSFWRHAPFTDLNQRPRFALYCKPKVAEFTVSGIRRRQPVLQATAMNSPQGSCTFTGRKQVFLTAAFVADPAHWSVIERTARQEGEIVRMVCDGTEDWARPNIS